MQTILFPICDLYKSQFSQPTFPRQSKVISRINIISAPAFHHGFFLFSGSIFISHKKGGTMTLMKRPAFPSLFGERWLNDFFDTDRFFDSDLLKMASIPQLPLVNIADEEKEYVVEMAVPGMSKKDFSISVENGMLTISAETKAEKEEVKKNFTRKEFSFNTFSRSFTLPENANDEKIAANYENGILKIHIAKKELTKVPPKKEIAVV
jgi:HSP20 family protein